MLKIFGPEVVFFSSYHRGKAACIIYLFVYQLIEKKGVISCHVVSGVDQFYQAKLALKA